MYSSETLNLNAQTVAKRPATKHVSNAHSTPISLPVESSIYFNPRLGYLGAKYRNDMTNPKPTSVSVLIFRSANQHSYSISSFLSSQDRRNRNKKRSNNKERTRTRKIKQTEFPTRREQLQTTDNRTSAAYSDLEQTTGVTHRVNGETHTQMQYSYYNTPCTKGNNFSTQTVNPVTSTEHRLATCPLNKLKWFETKITQKMFLLL